ncbi:MAG: class I tRNA ligase family protein, partial [Thermomicrobiales bacterium]
AKVRLRDGAAGGDVVAQTLAFTIERSLRLLHPFMPFITESLWQQVPHHGPSIMRASWPTAGPVDPAAEHQFGVLMDLVRGIRNARSEAGVEPGRWISADVWAGDLTGPLDSARAEFGVLARFADDQLHFHSGAAEHQERALTVLAGSVVVSLPLSDLVDLGAEKERLRKELEEAVTERGRAKAQLANESFMARAPEKVVQVQRQRLTLAIERIATLEARLVDVGSA